MMKKLRGFLFLCICFSCALAFLLNGLTKPLAVSAQTETLVGSKLQYFELNNPVSVWREGDVVYIAEDELIVIYQNDSYTTIPLEGFNVTSLKKCGNHLLLLSKGALYSVNLATFAVNLLSFDGVSQISAFSVFNDFFAITSNQSVLFFELLDKENFLFEKIDLGFEVELVANNSPLIAIDGNLNLYYHATSSNLIYSWESQSGKQGPCNKVGAVSPDCFFFDDMFYFKANDKIFALETDYSSPKLVCDLQALGINSSGDFFINDNRILICDTLSNRVVEFDLTSNALTNFEISFTKISIPNDFTLSLNQTPHFISILKDCVLYDINLSSSLDKGYFVFNGYHTQSHDQDYLVVGEISNNYYLIAGDKLALVLKSDYATSPIPLNYSNKQFYLTTNASAYVLPYLITEFASFDLQKHCALNQICSFDFEGVNYSLISFEDKIGYLPTSFLVESLFELPAFSRYETATTTNRSVKVFSDSNFSNECDTIPAKQSVVITEKINGGYHVIYGDNKTGYLLDSAIKKEGSFVNRNVAVIILLALSLTVTVIYLEFKYLYKKRKLSNPQKRK